MEFESGKLYRLLDGMLLFFGNEETKIIEINNLYKMGDLFLFLYSEKREHIWFLQEKNEGRIKTCFYFLAPDSKKVYFAFSETSKRINGIDRWKNMENLFERAGM